MPTTPTICAPVARWSASYLGALVVWGATIPIDVVRPTIWNFPSVVDSQSSRREGLAAA